MTTPDQYPEILHDLADCFRQRLNLILPADQAETLAQSIAKDVQTRYGGELLYIPKGEAFARASRNKTIAAEFDGSNHAALARRYGLTIATIYNIIGRERKAR